MTPVRDLHDLALSAAMAGAEAIRVIARGELATRDKGGVEDLVTAADLASERAVIAAIRQARPDDRIIAEESGDHAGTSEVRWYVDPLDGTSNFVEGSPNYAVSIAAFVDEECVAAVIYRPADGLWLGTSGETKLRGTLPPRIAKQRPMSELKVTVSRPHDPERRREAMDLRERLLPRVAEERRTGAATWALLLVATGELDAYVSIDLPLWDTAAGHLLVERAGGLVSTVQLASGRPVSIAGSPSAVSALADFVGQSELLR